MTQPVGSGSSATPNLPSSPMAAAELHAPHTAPAGAGTGVASTAAANAAAATHKADPQAVREAVDSANRKLEEDGRQLRFAFDGESRQLIVRLVDTSTQKVLSQYPSEDALRAARQVLSGKPIIKSEA